MFGVPVPAREGVLQKPTHRAALAGGGGGCICTHGHAWPSSRYPRISHHYLYIGGTPGGGLKVLVGMHGCSRESLARRMITLAGWRGVRDVCIHRHAYRSRESLMSHDNVGGTEHVGFSPRQAFLLPSPRRREVLCFGLFCSARRIKGWASSYKEGLERRVDLGTCE